MGIASENEPWFSAQARRGRPATASQADVIDAVTKQYLDGRRVDLTVVARELGLGRATIYRWFGSREALLGEVVAQQLDLLVERERRRVSSHGANGLLQVFDRVNRTLARSRALRKLIAQERAAGMRLLTSSGGVVQPRAVARIRALIEAEAAAGRYQPAAEPDTLAYAVVRLCEAFLYNDVAIGIRGDWERLGEVQAALLGVPPLARAPAGRETP